MSRVGQAPIHIPAGVTVDVKADAIVAKGKLGELSIPLPNCLAYEQQDNVIRLSPKSSSKDALVMWGTTRRNLHNMVTGVSQGFTVNLEIVGVGYRAAVQGRTLVLQLGYSHDVNFPIPQGIEIRCDKPTSIHIAGHDRQAVGQVAAIIRSYRPPEPYKGKGIKYENEIIVRKEGKKK